MKIRPLYDRIIVKVLDDEERTPGGLFIPQTADPHLVAGGVVLAVGDGMPLPDGSLRKMVIKVDDVIQFPRNALKGTTIPFDGHKDGTVAIIREPEVMAVFEDLGRDTGIVGPDGAPVVAGEENPRAVVVMLGVSPGFAAGGDVTVGELP